MRDNLPSAFSQPIIARVSVQTRRIARSSATESRLYPALALLVTIFAIAPLAYPGLWQSHNGYSAVYNLIDLHSNLDRFWSWSAAWGRAYDWLRMDGPLGYWLAVPAHAVGLSYLDSIKFVYALSFLASAIGMFGAARCLFHNSATALLAATVYVYFPAHIAAVYVRGAFGEALAWALLPLALWAVTALDTGQRERPGRHILITILVFAALMLVQPGLALLFGILIFFYLWLVPAAGVRPRELRRTLRSPALWAGLAGLALGLVLQLPSLLSHSNLSSSDGFVGAFVSPFQLLSASWGQALPRGDFMDEAPYQIGIAALGLTSLTVAFLLRTDMRAEIPPATRRLVWFALAATGVLILLMLPLLAPVWQWGGLETLVQYPFQLLLFLGLFLALAGASLVVADRRLAEIPLLAALVIVPVLAVYPYLAPTFLNLSPSRPALARFNNDELALLDARIIRPPGIWRHGATVTLELTWQALRQPNRDYTVFLHILDENGTRWGSVDEKPQEGTRTFDWLPGQVHTGSHSVQIELAGPPEGFHMELGIYQGTTGERAVTDTGATEIRIDENR
jgi:hypothetical protein